MISFFFTYRHQQTRRDGVEGDFGGADDREGFGKVDLRRLGHGVRLLISLLVWELFLFGGLEMGRWPISLFLFLVWGWLMVVMVAMLSK